MPSEATGYAIITIRARKEGDTYAAACAELGVEGRGATLDEAFARVRAAASEYMLSVLLSARNLPRVLADRGIPVRSGEPSESERQGAVTVHLSEYVSREALCVPSGVNGQGPEALPQVSAPGPDAEIAAGVDLPVTLGYRRAPILRARAVVTATRAGRRDLALSGDEWKSLPMDDSPRGDV